MEKRNYYTVGGHTFCLTLPEEDSLWLDMEESYVPFCDKRHDDILFSLTLAHALPHEKTEVVYKQSKQSEEQIQMDIYRSKQGYLFEFTPPFYHKPHAWLQLSTDYSEGTVALNGDNQVRLLCINSALRLMYILSAAGHNTLLTHASAVICDGKAYLFLGKSGTGKSTHSRLWQQHIRGVEPLNDDHPVVRINQQGEVIAYGSPWSGKTPCFRNMSAPIGGIVRLKQAPRNSIKQLSEMEAYASLLPAAAGMTWETKLAEGKNRTLQEVIIQVPCWTLECLPDKEAAVLCARTVGKEIQCQRG